MINNNSVWCHNDRRDIYKMKTGQIIERSNTGNAIISLLRNGSFDNILEIGTWNGLGSTLVIIKGLQGCSSYKSFYSIECNEDKTILAKKNLAPYILGSSLVNDLDNKIKLLWGSVLKKDEIELEKIYRYFPEVKDNSELKRWHTVDYENICRCPYILNELPNEFDIILFDGGEFTTIFEFNILLSRCKKYILLDDCNVLKCRKIREQLQKMGRRKKEGEGEREGEGKGEWEEIFHTDERNGFSIFKKC